MSTSSDWAANLARSLLKDGERYRHSEGVAARARELSLSVATYDVELLVAAAWLHDVGYSDQLRNTGFHPLDGARGLAHRGVDPAVTRLVAHHSAARFVAEDRGLAQDLAQFPRLAGPTADALTAADQTIGPAGVPMTLDERMRDMLARHGPESPNARVHSVRAPELRATGRRVSSKLMDLGLIDPWLS